MSDCTENACKLPLLPNNTPSETILHKSEAARSADWLLINVVPTRRWLGKYVTSDKKFYNIIFKQEAVASPSYLHIFLLIIYVDETFIWNMI
jgi:hypothetical protein